MKGFTIWEPWASLVADGRKYVETRSWSTTYRGDVAIHAGLYKDRLNDAIAVSFGYNPEHTSTIRGNIVAIATLFDIMPIEDAADLFPDQIQYGDFSPGRWAWMLRDIRKLNRPVPIQGSQGLWILDQQMESMIGYDIRPRPD